MTSENGRPGQDATPGADATPGPDAIPGNDAIPGHDRYSIQGREVTLPLHVGHARAGIAAYSADAIAVESALPTGLAPLEVLPGRALVLFQLVEYLDNPLGDYAEGVVASVVRSLDDATGPVVEGPLANVAGPIESLRAVLGGHHGIFVHHMPVDQSFTLEAGRTIWGFPKTLDTLDLRMSDARAGLRWSTPAGEILELTLPRGGSITVPAGPGTAYTHAAGRTWRTRLTFRGTGARFGPGGARLRLGTHPIADQLRAFGLSRRALFTAWVEHAAMDFEAADPIS
jgi:hypothetical protein